MFEYFTKRYTTIEDLQDSLTEKGKEGWRLHTCDELQKGHSKGCFLVVMDRFLGNNVEPENETKEEAMACKG